MFGSFSVRTRSLERGCPPETRALIAGSYPDPGKPTQLFAYGSLIWKPEIEHKAEQTGVARSWHRAFCLRQHRFRGTPDQPGLMMALDRGGQCSGVL